MQSIIFLYHLIFGLGQCNEDLESEGCCPQNERLYQCSYPCKRNSCEAATENPNFFRCSFLAQKAEQPYCDCENGFYRNPNGDCVTDTTTS